MEIDINRTIGATVREVRDIEHEGEPARAVIASRDYQTDIGDLWDALTNFDRIPRWFLPISGDPRLGGRFQLKDNAAGTIEVCDPPHSLGVTWEYGGGKSWVRTTLTEKATDVTHLHLEHIAIVADIEEFWQQYGAGATGVGWDLGLLGLQEYIDTGVADSPAISPEANTEWMQSENYKQFVRASSTGWRDAAIAAGMDAATAESAAINTTAFYGGAEGS